MGKLEKQCAYCGKLSELSREHVWPRCLLARRRWRHAHFSPASQKVHGADYVVRDVCKSCNNVSLSKVDLYLCRLYDMYFAEPKQFGGSSLFFFDEDVLLRALLKISYNSARYASSEVEPFHRFRGYILGEAVRPTGVCLLLDLVSPTRITSQHIPDLFDIYLDQIGYRSCRVDILGPAGNYVYMRMIGINSFYFYLIIARSEDHAVECSNFKSEFVKIMPGVSDVMGKHGFIPLRSTGRDGLSSMLPHLFDYMEEYDRYFGRNSS